MSQKILVSMIAYRERYLAESVKDCYDKAANPKNLLFSIVSEQSREDLHADLSFIPEDQIIYRKYDLSKYRGVLWSRHKTTEVDFEYNYILYTCGHNRFASNWDELTLSEYKKALIKSDKSVITVAAPEFFYDENSNPIYNSSDGRQKNYWRSTLDSDYIPGYGWSTQREVPDIGDVLEETYLQYSWVFGPKEYVDEVPLDPDMSYHGEEIYMTIQTWCRGWKMYSTPVIMYYHDTEKKYPQENNPRMTTHRPWSDINKDPFWEQSDRSMVKLNALLSGTLSGPYGGISKEQIEAYCDFSNLNKKWTVLNPDYDKLGIKRHGEFFRNRSPYLLD